MDSSFSIFQIPEDHFLFTSESVSPGHPDKLCDYISDCIVDANIKQDPMARVACEAAAKNDIFMVFGEITSNANITYDKEVREAIKSIGYDDKKLGADYKTCIIIVNIDKQSPEIGKSVSNDTEEPGKKKEIGAGDQGLMIGYACDETETLMPLSHHFALKLSEKLSEARVKKSIKWLRPDAKTQVTVEYKKTKDIIEPVRVHTVLVSAQHDEEVTKEQITKDITEKIIKTTIPSKYLDEKTRIIVNPSAAFTMGGPMADAGLTGRKIIVDTYGGWGGHGGGAFSGKDPTKVDRSGAYAARWVAKSLVAAKLCRRCMVQLAYGIGIAEPLSIHVDTYGTVAEGYSDNDLKQIVRKNFKLTPGAIIDELKLRRPIYHKLSAFGHFGREDPDFLWEFPKKLNLS